MYYKRKRVGESTKDMKPRIFVSSTFYDLKYMREDLSNFIKAHDFEPIMFEEGDVGYTPGKYLDESCYETMRNADMVIMIIGGNYGRPATGEKTDPFEEYLSITRKEFETAVKAGIPVYVFIDSSVYSEFGVYESNIRAIEENRLSINFRATKSINVFRFVKEIKNIGNISITEFRRPNEVKDFLSKQWADMFKSYLKLLREEKNTEQIHEAMNSMNSLIEQMRIMINGLGQKLINNDQNIQYDKLLKQQYRVIARDIAKKISRNLFFEFENINQNESNVSKLVDEICSVVLEIRNNGSKLDKENTLQDFSIDRLFDNFCGRLAEAGIFARRLNLNFLFEDDSLYEMCCKEEIKDEVKKILSGNFYYSRMIGKSEENEEELELEE